MDGKKGPSPPYELKDHPVTIQAAMQLASMAAPIAAALLNSLPHQPPLDMLESLADDAVDLAAAIMNSSIKPRAITPLFNRPPRH